MEIKPDFETPELREAFDKLLRASDAVKRAEIIVRLSVYKHYVFKDYINKN